MKRIGLMLCLLVMLAVPLFAEDEYLPGKDRFQLCENKSGGGFFWADTSTAEVWLMDSGRKGWTPCGKPDEAQPAEIGTYLPYPNRNGRGMFILNTFTGDGWYFDGKLWFSLGKPETKSDSE